MQDLLFQDGALFSDLVRSHGRGGNDADLPRCIDLLFEKGFTWQGRSFASSDDLPGEATLAQAIQRGRVRKLTQDDLRAAETRYRASPEGKRVAEELKSPERQGAIWQEFRERRQSGVRLLTRTRLPADAIAFYRYFHVEPFDDWGIYFDVPKLLTYAEGLHTALWQRWPSLSFEAVLHSALFEIFHHEFFHHLVECAATTLELLGAMQGNPRPLFRDYKEGEFRKHPELAPPHDPLEEALANAYAYNAFGFLSRVQLGYSTVLGRSYQKAIESHWGSEGPGYRDASHYIKDSYLPGGAQLLGMLLNQPDLDPSSLLLLVKHVLLHGNSAYAAKPEIPTYLIGDKATLARFESMVPTPNETYTQLYWAADTSALDTYLRERRRQEQEQKAAAKQAKESSG